MSLNRGLQHLHGVMVSLLFGPMENVVRKLELCATPLADEATTQLSLLENVTLHD